MIVYVTSGYQEDKRTGEVTGISVNGAFKSFRAARDFIYNKIELLVNNHNWVITRDEHDMLDRFAFEWSVTISYGNTDITFIICSFELR